MNEAEMFILLERLNDTRDKVLVGITADLYQEQVEIQRRVLRAAGRVIANDWQPSERIAKLLHSYAQAAAMRTVKMLEDAVNGAAEQTLKFVEQKAEEATLPVPARKTEVN